MMHKIKKRDVLIALLVASLASLLLTPVSQIKQGIIDNLPWVGVGTLITETLFIIGLGIMALEAGHELGKNPVLWRRKLHKVVRHLVKTKMFWIGFWINAAGAAGTAVIVAIGIFKVLPPRNWGLLLLPALDLGLTFALRLAAVQTIEEA
ncbi:hypothetical protein KW794_01660 [Candidatus Saccharibacteria bacterium]|nr:hypothetical protein [Candidatus Saccharibacteria bacterium]